MNLDYFIKQMAANAETISSLVEGVSARQACWKPDPDSWSILEVINHLYDEEREDFRVRLDYILHHPDKAWPNINPGGWVSERHYNQRELTPSLRNFLHARKESISWLQDISLPNWQAGYSASFGDITAGDMFAAWVAHDLLHLRQLVELHWAFTVAQLHPCRVNYAGGW